MVEALIVLGTFVVILLILMVVFAVRTHRLGMPHTEALSKKGSSKILNRWMLEFVYWLLDPLVRGLVWCRIHPNTISWASVFFAGFGAVAFTKGFFGYGTLLSVAAFLLDALDGMVARMANMKSGAGAVLDSTLDRYTEFLFFVGLLYYYRYEPLAMGVVAMALCGSWMVSYSSAKAEAIQVPVPRGTMRRPERLVILVVGTGLAPLLTPLLEKNAPYPLHYPVLVALGIVAVFSNATAIHRLYCLYRTLAEKANIQSLTCLSTTSQWSLLRKAILSSSIPTIVDFVILAWLVIRAGMDYVPATVVSVSAGTLFGYFVRRWLLEFRRADFSQSAALQELVIAFTNILWNVLLVFGFTEWLGIHFLISRALAGGAVGLVWNWPLNFRYIFPSERTES